MMTSENADRQSSAWGRTHASFSTGNSEMIFIGGSASREHQADQLLAAKPARPSRIVQTFAPGAVREPPERALLRGRHEAEQREQPVAAEVVEQRLVLVAEDHRQRGAVARQQADDVAGVHRQVTGVPLAVVA